MRSPDILPGRFGRFLQDPPYGSGVEFMAERSGVGAAEPIPVKLTVPHPRGDLGGEIDGSEMVMVGDSLMVHYDIRDLAAVQQRDEGIIYEMQGYDIHERIGSQRVTDYSLEAENLFPRAEEIGVVVDGRLDEQKVRNAMGEDVFLEAEGVGSRAERGYSGVDELEPGVREPSCEVFLDHVLPPGHLRDRTSEESHRGLLPDRHRIQGVVQVASSMNMLIFSIFSPVAIEKIHDRSGILQAVGMVVAVGFHNDLDRPAHLPVGFLNYPHILIVRNNLVRTSADRDDRDSGLRYPREMIYRVALETAVHILVFHAPFLKEVLP